MEKVNLIRKNALLRLPPGFRFHPTDEELVVQYLKRKVLSYPLPASIIPEVDVYKSDPWDLPGDTEEEMYFFSTREVKYPNGNRSNRATGSGYWKATGLDKQIVSTNSKIHQKTVTVGMKKTLVFYRGKPPKGSRTDWVMHEYRLTNSLQSNINLAQENWVLCRIFLKRKNNNKSSVDEVPVPVFYDFMGQKERGDLIFVQLPSNSSSASSGITDDNVESSSCNSLTATFTQGTNVLK